MDRSLDFTDLGMDLDALDVLPTYNLHRRPSTDRLGRLREILKDRGLEAYLIVDSDAHYTFYSQARQDRRINYITNSDAQCGVAIVAMEKAAFKPLNAYLLMADLETDENWEILHESQTLENWIRKEIGQGKIGYDPVLTPIMVYENFAKVTSHLVPVKENLIDLASEAAKPTLPLGQTWVLKQEFTGLNSYDKISYLRKKMKENQCDCYVVTALDEIAWLLNSSSPVLPLRNQLTEVRGNDMECNPVFYAFMVLLPEEIFLFIEESQLNWPVIGYTTTYSSIRHLLPYATFYNFLEAHGGVFKRWWVDPRSSIAVLKAVGRERAFVHRSLIQDMKSIKNNVEISGMHEAHLRDCGAACDLFGWLENQIYNDNMVKESDVPIQLTEFQRKRMHYIGPSFETMACTAINAAAVEYVPQPDSCAYITSDSLFMLDAGANYKDGTTDFTRTIHYGIPTDLEKEIYTRILKGLLAIEVTSFPEGTTGHQLDSIIRQHLWAGGFDYPGVATGHGVSHGLGVIEGGASISSMKIANQLPVREGMIMTVEPGVYLPWILGIRLENVYVVTASNLPRYTLLHPTLVRQRKFLRFVTLDYIPFQRKMILDDLMTRQEMDLLRDYHRTCIDRISGQCMTDAGRIWLLRESQAWL